MGSLFPAALIPTTYRSEKKKEENTNNKYVIFQ